MQMIYSHYMEEAKRDTLKRMEDTQKMKDIIANECDQDDTKHNTCSDTEELIEVSNGAEECDLNETGKSDQDKVYNSSMNRLGYTKMDYIMKLQVTK